jgi:hypothetical protein
MWRGIILIFVCVFKTVFTAYSQNKDEFILNRYSSEISFIRMDSTHSSQTTVVQYKDFLVLIELPFIDHGGNKSTNLREDTLKATSLISYLNSNFGNKPVKYIFSSHWHLHSLSGISPFLKHGAKLVCTKANWNYSIQNGLLNGMDKDRFNFQLIAINKDTTLLTNTPFPIRAIYLDSTFKNKPTKDYLFFYLPKIKTLYASCMCAIEDIDVTTAKGYVVSDRLTDLNAVINSRHLMLENLIKLGREKQANGSYLMPVYSYTYLKDFMANGKTLHVFIKSYTDLPLTTLRNAKDSILHETIKQNISPDVLNQAIYECIKTKYFDKAIQLAQLLNLYAPEQLNYIDSMGEAYFGADDLVAASYYDKLIMTANPGFEGGMKAWIQNKKDNNY